MAALKVAVLALALCGAAPARGESVADWRNYTAEASVRFGIPVAWIERVMRAESGGRTIIAGRPITSRAGAMGLMQVMPTTWAELRITHALGGDPYDPRDNILAGTAYLRAMYDRFGYPGLFAAYNAGPARYARYLAGDTTLPDETRAYLAAVTGKAPPATPVGPTAPSPTLFVVLRRAASSPVEAPSAPLAPGLFVPLSPR